MNDGSFLRAVQQRGEILRGDRIGARAAQQIVRRAAQQVGAARIVFAVRIEGFLKRIVMLAHAKQYARAGNAFHARERADGIELIVHAEQMRRLRVGGGVQAFKKRRIQRRED